MTQWNPTDPALIGPEYFGATDTTVNPARNVPLIQRFGSTAAETIEALRLYITTDAATDDDVAYLAEVFGAGDELDDGDFTVETFAPNELSINSGTWVDESLATPTDPSAIDEWPPSYTDYLLGTGGTIQLSFATAAFAATGRIAYVAVEIVTRTGYLGAPTSGYTRKATVNVTDGIGEWGTFEKTIPTNTFSGNAGRAFFAWGEINPVTEQPWTEQDIQDLDDPLTLAIRLGPFQDAGSLILSVAAVRLIVVHETSERREARGAFYPTPGDPIGWTADIDLADPDGVANWSKADATDYALVVRQADQGDLSPLVAVATMALLIAVDGYEAPAGLESYDGASTIADFLTDGGVTASGYSLESSTAAPGQLVPFVLRAAGPATSVDGQPYAQVLTRGISVVSGSTQQELRTSTSDDYAQLRLPVGWYFVKPTSALIVAVKRRSDNAVMGTFTFAADEVDELAAGEYAVVQASTTPFALASATQYYLDFTTLSPEGTFWIFPLLAVEAGGGGVLYEEATYSQGVDRADPIQGTAATALDYTPADIPALLGVALDPPAGLAADPAVAGLPDEGGPCPMDGLPFMSVTWSTVATAGFGYYGIERLAPDGVTWQVIAELPDIDNDGFYDVEARIGVEESYRLRYVLDDGSSSSYSDTVSATVVSAGCGYTFTSNLQPESSVAYPDTYDRQAIRDYSFPEADEVVYRKLYGRDYQVAFHPLSRRGVTFARRLAIAGLAAPAAGVGPPAADLLRDLVWDSDLPYVCVRDNDGNRWYASVRVPSMDAYQNRGAHLIWVAVGVVEVTGTPYPSTVGVDAPGGAMEFVDGSPILFVDTDEMSFVT